MATSRNAIIYVVPSSCPGKETTSQMCAQLSYPACDRSQKPKVDSVITVTIEHDDDVCTMLQLCEGSRSQPQWSPPSWLCVLQMWQTWSSHTELSSTQ